MPPDEPLTCFFELLLVDQECSSLVGIDKRRNSVEYVIESNADLALLDLLPGLHA